MTDATELDDLDGIGGPFWARFKAHAITEWGPAGQRYQQAVKQAASKGDDSIHALRMVLFAQEEIGKLLQWPEERIAQIKGQAALVGLPSSRRGVGL